MLLIVHAETCGPGGLSGLKIRVTIWKKDATLQTEIVLYCFRTFMYIFLPTHLWTTVTRKGKAVPLLVQAPRREGVWGSGVIAS